MAQWYYARGAQQVGPTETDALRQMLASGQLSHQDLVWRDGMTDWVPAGSIPELSAAGPAAAQAPVAPPQPTNFAYPPSAPLGYAGPTGGGQRPFGEMGLAILALVLSCVGVPAMCCCYTGFLFGTAGIVCGVVARGNIRRSGNLKGDGVALAAIIVGACAVLIQLAFFMLGFIHGFSRGFMHMRHLPF